MKQWKLCSAVITACTFLSAFGASACHTKIVEVFIQETETAPKILIAYFTSLDNTQASREEILQGGGPHGLLRDSLEGADMDAVSSASIQLIDGRV